MMTEPSASAPASEAERTAAVIDALAGPMGRAEVELREEHVLRPRPATLDDWTADYGGH